MKKSVSEMKKGEQGSVLELLGGRMFQNRLENMGIRRGKRLYRVSAQLMGGPVIVSVDGRQTAMGRNMAAKVIVNTNEK
jgi:ferrous iron transport protein A